jgi:hypothetical protein
VKAPRAPALSPVEPVFRSAGKLNPAVLSMSPRRRPGAFVSYRNAAQNKYPARWMLRRPGKGPPKIRSKIRILLFLRPTRKSGVRRSHPAPLTAGFRRTNFEFRWGPSLLPAERRHILGLSYDTRAFGCHCDGASKSSMIRSSPNGSLVAEYNNSSWSGETVRPYCRAAGAGATSMARRVA